VVLEKDGEDQLNGLCE